MQKSLLSALLLLLVHLSFGQRLTLAVAANAQYVMKDLVEEFKKQTRTEIDLVIGSSGKLTAQIEQGAPFHIFFSADMKYPQELYNKGFAVAEPKVYGYGLLVLWTMMDIPLNKDLKMLSGMRKIALANPESAPYGEQALKVLKQLDLYDNIKDKIVYGESIAQVNQYVGSQSCDVGFTSKSSVLSAELKGKGRWMEMDRRYYNAIAQGVVLLKRGKEEVGENAAKFLKFVFSSQGRKILEAQGYLLTAK